MLRCKELAKVLNIFAGNEISRWVGQYEENNRSTALYNSAE